MPNNCFVTGNSPLDFASTGGYYSSKNYQAKLSEYDELPEEIKAFNYAQETERWDAGYREKVNNNGTFIITEAIRLELAHPIHFTDALVGQVFGPRFPNTRSLRRIDDAQFWKLMDLLPERLFTNR